MKRERAKANLQRRLERIEKKAGIHNCSTCAAWHDVILTKERDPKGQIEAPDEALVKRQWGPWHEHAGTCPDCGRKPQVFHVILNWKMLATPGYTDKPRPRLPER
jgi:hypothetical protein